MNVDLFSVIGRLYVENLMLQEQLRKMYEEKQEVPPANADSAA